MLTITHTREAGTLIESTTKGDGTAAILKTTGWRWGRSIGQWFVPQSRDRAAKTYIINATVERLTAAGYEVTTDIDDTARATADVEADKIERQAQRAIALEAKAERVGAQAEALYDQTGRLADAIPFGQPILVGHHSEGRDRRYRDRIANTMDKAVATFEEATALEERAATAARTTNRRYDPITVANRIKTIGAEIRKHEREITGHTNNRGDTFSPASPQGRERLEAQIAELSDQLTYWEGVRAEQIANGTATNYSRETISKGDHVLIGGQWREVVRVNAASVSVKTGYSWTDTAPYATIKDHRPAE